MAIKPLFEAAIKEKRVSTSTRLNGSGIKNAVIGVLHLLQGGVDAYSNYKWWKEADQLKQKGFYVDYKNGLLTPEIFTIDQYQIALKNIRIIKNDLDNFMKVIIAMREPELKRFRRVFEDSEFKKVINDSINGRNLSVK